MIEVLRAGPLTTVQDLGRPGLAHMGVPRSGALDEPALRLANRLVGNPPGAAIGSAADESTVDGGPTAAPSGSRSPSRSGAGPNPDNVSVDRLPSVAGTSIPPDTAR